MNVRLALPVIAVIIAAMPLSIPNPNNSPTFNGDTYSVIDNCIYDSDGNLTECGE